MTKMKTLMMITMLMASFGLAHAQEAALVYPGSNGKLEYVLHANTGETDSVNVIPDFSHFKWQNESDNSFLERAKALWGYK